MPRPLARTLAVLCVLAATSTARAQWLQACQEPDGHWPSARYGGRDNADLRTTSLTLLTLLGNGNTLRSGPQRELLRNGVQWLLAQQDARGRIGLRADPEWFFDHALATCVLLEALRASAPDWPLLAPVRSAVAALSEHVRVVGPKLGVEEQVWCHLVAACLGDVVRVCTAAWPAARQQELGALHAAPALASRLARMPPPVGATARERAACFLLDVVAGRITEPASALPDVWPQDVLADPLVTFYCAAALFRLGGAGWRQAAHKLAALVHAEQQQGDPPGTLPPSGEVGQVLGRLGYSAAVVLSVQIYYRYTRLWLTNGE